MVKVRVLATDMVIEVTKNVAFGLIDSGKAVRYTGKRESANLPQEEPRQDSSYFHRQMKPSFKGGGGIRTK